MNETTKRQLLAGIIALTGSTLVAGCAKLDALNALNRLTPGDGNVERIVEGAPFGSDPRQRLDVYAPARRSIIANDGGPAVSEAARPVLIFFYGGGWNSGSRGDYAFVARAFAARGFIVVVPDYRLVPQVVFPAFVKDAASALRWTVDHIAEHGGDPRRIGIAGHSAGAYNAVMLALDAGFAWRVGVSPTAVRAVVGLSGPYDFLPLDVASSIAAFGHAPDLTATQPVHFARRDAPPALLLTGADDDIVRPRNAVALDAALRRAGASSALKIYPGLGHIGILLALSKPFRGKAAVLDDTAGFLQQQLA